MVFEPIHKRNYHVFLSHSSADKKTFVDDLYRWFKKVANIPVWYDQAVLSGGSIVPDSLGKAIPECRSMVLILSKSSVKSPWVRKEYSLAEHHRTQFEDFKIIPILIEDCELPPFLQDSIYIDARTNYLTESFYQGILQALYPFDPSVDFRKTSDIFVSRTWRNNDEAILADRACREFIKSGFRLIGDATDHPSYTNSKQRVENIIASCGGFLAILPYRKDNTESSYTSPYCLDEIRLASLYNLPSIVIAESGVDLSEELQQSVTYFYQAQSSTTGDENDDFFVDATERMKERWKTTKNEHYVFFATNFDEPELNQMIRQLLQQITGMPCILGEDLHTPGVSIQEAIAQQIRNASLTVADISQENINTLIEAGIARGANVQYRMVARETDDSPRRRPPFMFRDQQIEYYRSGAELLGRIHRLAYPFRRRILNREIRG
ncbi:MAG: toll/interleukin-1 receptor domain-containing protein [Cyanobacteria bacterium P01_F01_bin.53]